MLGMVVVHRAHGFRFVIYTLDHEPAHVHIIGADGHAKVNLLGPGGQPELVSKTIRRSDRAADLNEEQLKRAEARGRKMLEEPRAAAAHYDAATGRVVVDLA